jgi:hypothetical protein
LGEEKSSLMYSSSKHTTSSFVLTSLGDQFLFPKTVHALIGRCLRSLAMSLSWPSLYHPGLEILHIPHRDPVQPGAHYLYNFSGEFLPLPTAVVALCPRRPTPRRVPIHAVLELHIPHAHIPVLCALCLHQRHVLPEPRPPEAPLSTSRAEHIWAPDPHPARRGYPARLSRPQRRRHGRWQHRHGLFSHRALPCGRIQHVDVSPRLPHPRLLFFRLGSRAACMQMGPAPVVRYPSRPHPSRVRLPSAVAFHATDVSSRLWPSVIDII